MPTHFHLYEQFRKLIIYNPFHSDARQQSDLMHELAHIICKHEGDKMHPTLAILGLRNIDPEQEEEAKCLGASLQIPTSCLIWAIKRNMTHVQIAEYFKASIEMVKYRMNITGIAKRKLN